MKGLPGYRDGSCHVSRSGSAPLTPATLTVKPKSEEETAQ